MADAVAPSLSNYQILSQLSAGGMGAVYLAEDLKLHRKVAIKALTPEWAADPDRYRRFRWEAQVLAKLNHPNIVTIHAVEEEEGSHFLIMELVEGQTLDQLIPSVGMSPEEVFRIAIPLADALAAAHDRGIIHRDLKPGNVMVTDDGRVKVLDFGLAKRQDSAVTPETARMSVRESQPETQAGQMMGTIPYMSPEQLQGDTIDPRADIFSLGIILYEMATGSRPFAGKTWGDLASSILRDKPPSVTALNVYLPRHLGRIIRHCLEKDPNRRFQTALDLRNELEELQREMITGEVHSGEIASGPLSSGIDVRSGEFRDSSTTIPAPGRPGPVSGRRDREKLLAAAATLLVVAATAALIWLRYGPATETPTMPLRPPSDTTEGGNRIVVLPLENLGPTEDAYFTAGITEEITSRLASVSALQVISRTTALQYDRAQKTVQQVGAELGIDYLLDGTVRWSTGDGDQNRVRVTPQLTRVADGTTIWSERYDRVMDDIFAVQSEIAAEVIRQLDIALLEPEREALAASRTTDIEAYQAYLRGMDYASRREPDPETLELAEQMFSRAVQLDPQFALAWVELSEVHSRMVLWAKDRGPQRLEKAREAAEKALAIDPDLPEGHRALAYFHYWGNRDYQAALAEFEIAMRALPNDSQLIEGVAYIRRRQGRFEEAVTNLERALEFQPQSDWIAAELAETYTVMRRYEEADRYYQRAITLVPDQPFPYQRRAHNYLLWRGDVDAARRTLAAMPRQQHTGSLLAWYQLEVIARNDRAAIDRLNKVRPEVQLIGIDAISYPRHLLYALSYQRLGEHEAAKTLFENARGMLERRLPPGVVDARMRVALGVTYAGLGRKEDAVRTGLEAIEESPSADPYSGPRFIEHLATIYVMVGDHETALDHLEHLLSIPSWMSIPLLKLDPRWDPLRQEPRFQALIEEAAAAEVAPAEATRKTPARAISGTCCSPRSMLAAGGASRGTATRNPPPARPEVRVAIWDRLPVPDRQSISGEGR